MNLIFCMWLHIHKYIHMFQFIYMGVVIANKVIANIKFEIYQKTQLSYDTNFFAFGSIETANWFSYFKQFGSLVPKFTLPVRLLVRNQLNEFYSLMGFGILNGCLPWDSQYLGYTVSGTGIYVEISFWLHWMQLCNINTPWHHKR